MAKFILWMALSVLAPAAVFAAEGVLTLEAAIAEVMAANPAIHAAGYRAAEAQARIPQAKALDDPMVGVTFENVPIDTVRVRQGEMINYRLQQNLPFPGKRTTRGKAARFDAQAAAATARGSIQNVLLDCKQTYYQLYRIDRALGINRDNQHLLRQLAASTATWYATGQTTADAPLKAQVELSKLKNDAIMLQQERVTHQSHLQAILNRSTHDAIRLPATLQWPRLTVALEDLQAMAGNARPELKTLAAMRAREAAKLTVAKQRLLPDALLGFEYNQRPNQQDAWTGMAMINVPIFASKNRGAIQEAKAALNATTAEERSLQAHTRHEIDQAYSGVRAAERVVAAYQREIVPQARATLDAAQVAYAARKVDFLTVLDAARTYYDLRMALYENQALLGSRFAELERLVGEKL